MSAILNENTQFLDASGSPVVNGYIYIGDRNADPETNPQTIYSDRDFQTTLTNPQRTGSDGRPVNKIWVNGRYSIKIEDSNNNQLMLDLDAGEAGSTGISQLTNVVGVDAITAEGAPFIPGLVDSQIYTFKAAGANTGAVTLSIDSQAAKGVKKQHDVDLDSGDLEANMIVSVAYNSTDDTFELISNVLSGADLVTVVNMSALTSASTTYGANLLGYHSAIDGGGGIWRYNGSGDKADHNGITIVDPDIVFPSDWSNSTQLNTWFTASTGTGVWEKVYSGPIWPKWAGAKTTGNDSTIPLQEFINLTASLGESINFDADQYDFTDLYFHYDVTNNPGYPSAARNQGRLVIRGAGPGSRTNFTNTDYQTGTCLNCTSGTGGLHFGDGTNTRSVHFRDFAVWGNTTGNLVDIDYVPQYSRFRDLFIGNLGNGTALRIESVWSSIFENIDIHGNTGGVVGKGLHFDNASGSTGAGLNIYKQITCSYFETGFQLGNTYNASNTESKVNTLIAIQPRYCTYGMNIYNGFGCSIIGLWAEVNTNYDINVAESCSKVEIANARFLSTSSDGNIVLGKSSGSLTNKQFTSFKLTGVDRLVCTAAGIRKHAYAGAPPVILENISFVDDGGFAIHLDSADHGNIHLGEGIEFSGYTTTDDLRVGSGTIGSPVAEWELVRGGFLPEFSGASPSITSLYSMPEAIKLDSASNNVSLSIPSDRTTFIGWNKPTTFFKPSSLNSITLDAGTGNTIKGAQTYVISAGTGYKGITLRPQDDGASMDWEVVAEW